jgi:hypothetical protein
MKDNLLSRPFQVRIRPRAREHRLPPVPRMCAALALRREAESHFRKIPPIHPAATLLDDGRTRFVPVRKP